MTVVGTVPGQMTIFGPTGDQTVSGSGVFISDQGYLLTNNHVVEGTTEVKIVLSDGFFLAISAVLYGGMDGVRAQPREASEYAVKAAFLYNFAKFVEWPASSFPRDETAVAICVLGEDPFGSALQVMQGKTVGARRIAVKQIEGIEAIKSCHIVFVSDSEVKRLGPIFEAARTAHVLTVSDMPRFFRTGGMIALSTEQGKVRCSINADAAERAGLKISTPPLKLAGTITE